MIAVEIAGIDPTDNTFALNMDRTIESMFRFHKRTTPKEQSNDADHEYLGNRAAVDRIEDAIQRGFRRMTIHLEDTIVTFPAKLTPFTYESGVYRDADDNEVFDRDTVAFDIVTGTVHRANLNEKQILSIVELGLMGDDCRNPDETYITAVEAIQGWPIECRPIP